MGCGSCSKPETVGEQTVKSEPWAPIQPYLLNAAGAANQLFNGTPPMYYPGSTVAPFSPQQEMGMSLITGRALAGSPLNDAAQGQAYNTISGGFLNSNPYLDGMYDRAASAVTRNYSEAVKPGIDSQFINSGMYGSELWQNAQDSARDQLGRSLEGMASNIYGNNYEAERGRMQSMIGMAPQLAQSDYADFDRLMGVGGQIQGQGQAQIQDQKNRWDYYQNLPEQMLNNYTNTVTALGGMGGQQSQPLYGNSPMQNATGGGLLAAAIGKECC